MGAPVRIGVVGCGSVMQGGYMPIARDLQARGAAEVRMACDASPEREELARALGIPAFTTDYRALVGSADIDLVLVLTPPAHHYPIAAAALAAGKHVLVEKPMALALDDAAALVRLAGRSPGLLHAAPHIVLSPTYQEIGRRLRRGDIGDVFTARGLCGHGGPDWGPWYYRAGGGGPLFDLAVYNVTSLTGWLGPVRRVTAFMGTAIPERTVGGETVAVEVEDNAQILLDFSGAAFATVASSFTIQQYRGATLELYGSRGTIRLLGDDWAPDGYELWQAGGEWQRVPEAAPEWSYLDGLRHLVDCIERGARPLVTPEHAYHVLEVLLMAREAARTGRPQEIASTFPPLSFAETRP